MHNAAITTLTVPAREIPVFALRCSLTSSPWTLRLLWASGHAMLRFYVDFLIRNLYIHGLSSLVSSLKHSTGLISSYSPQSSLLNFLASKIYQIDIWHDEIAIRNAMSLAFMISEHILILVHSFFLILPFWTLNKKIVQSLLMAKFDTLKVCFVVSLKNQNFNASNSSLVLCINICLIIKKW